jgi:hypothetical protein
MKPIDIAPSPGERQNKEGPQQVSDIKEEISTGS